MPELRRNPLTGIWVVAAPERAKRPEDVRVDTSHERGGACPFCPGNERATRDAIHEMHDTNGAWTIRTVANRYPALRIEGTPWRRAEGFYDRVAGIGAHEVIVDTPRHDPAPWTSEEARRVFRMIRARTMDLAQDNRIQHCVPFKNHGALAGATLSHHHSQIIALPLVPRTLIGELENASTHHSLHGRSLLNDMVDNERDAVSRVVHADDRVTAFCPFASQAPFETWVVPRSPGAHMVHASLDDLDHVADITARILQALDRAVPNTGYNILWIAAPMREAARDDYLWHVRILPALSRIAGFEWATGHAINATLPQDAAAFLRRQWR